MAKWRRGEAWKRQALLVLPPCSATHLMAAVVPRQTVRNCDDFVGGAGLKRALVIMTLKDYSGFKT